MVLRSAAWYFDERAPRMDTMETLSSMQAGKAYSLHLIRWIVCCTNSYIWLTEVCHRVAIESHLQPLTGEHLSYNSAITEDGARLDVAMFGFWGGRFEKAFLDVRVFLT